MSLSRRELLKAGAASGALLVARPVGALAQALGPAPEFATSRVSRLFPSYRLAHADLHNHTLMSDGDGSADDAFGSMRSAGLDVAALTDHATTGVEVPGLSGCSECSSLFGIDETKWARAGEIADRENSRGRFVAIRGFEWSSPTLGHINVWFSESWVDPLHTGGASTGEGVGQFMHAESDGWFPQEMSQPIDTLMRVSPTSGTTMQPFYEWLKRSPDTPLLGGGLDGIAGFNHPGRETGRFGYFAFEPALAERLVSVEVFNRREDYLFEGTDHGVQSPINECLNAGWRVGLLGVTDEHGTDWGYPDGKGRTGVWIRGQLSRESVRAALLDRRFFATRLRGLRVDASANGIPMGGTLPHTKGPVRFHLDIDRGSHLHGHTLNVQVIGPGEFMPMVIHNEAVTVPAPGQPPVSFTVDLNIDETKWVFLRITDPAPSEADRKDPDYPSVDGRAAEAWRGYGAAIAYCSPFFLAPGSLGEVDEDQEWDEDGEGNDPDRGAAASLLRHRHHHGHSHSH